MNDMVSVSEFVNNVRQTVKKTKGVSLPKPHRIIGRIAVLEEEIRLLRAVEPVSREVYGDLDDTKCLSKRTRRILRKLGVKDQEDIEGLRERDLRRRGKTVVEEVKDFLRTRGKKLSSSED